MFLILWLLVSLPVISWWRRWSILNYRTWCQHWRHLIRLIVYSFQSRQGHRMAGERQASAAGRMWGEAAVDGSTFSSALPPPTALSLIVFIQGCLLCRWVWQSLSTCWQITLRTGSFNWEVDIRSEMSTGSVVLSGRDMIEQIPNSGGHKHFSVISQLLLPVT